MREQACEQRDNSPIHHDRDGRRCEHIRKRTNQGKCAKIKDRYRQGTESCREGESRRFGEKTAKKSESRGELFPPDDNTDDRQK